MSWDIFSHYRTIVNQTGIFILKNLDKLSKKGKIKNWTNKAAQLIFLFQNMQRVQATRVRDLSLSDTVNVDFTIITCWQIHLFC
jgi:hypothetical protein